MSQCNTVTEANNMSTSVYHRYNIQHRHIQLTSLTSLNVTYLVGVMCKKSEDTYACSNHKVMCKITWNS